MVGFDYAITNTSTTDYGRPTGNGEAMEPRIVGSWDELPPVVFAEGELFSTRLLELQHRESNNRVLELLEEVDRMQAAIDSWKEWHRAVAKAAGCEVVERNVTLKAVRKLKGE